MKKDFDEIIADIDQHLTRSDKLYYSDYYIGITNDVNRRLFEEHNVSKDNAWWIYREADDKETAQSVEEYYLQKGMQGDAGGGTIQSRYVYCFEITNDTMAQQQKSVEWKTLSKDISNSEHKKWHVLYTSDLCSECFHL